MQTLVLFSDRWILAIACALALAALGCEIATEEPARFDVRPSVEQIHVTNAVPGLELSVYRRAGGTPPADSADDRGEALATGVADDLGSLIFRELSPGDDYYVEAPGVAAAFQVSGPHTVMSVEGSLPDRDFYEGQVLGPGFNYITTRDGTKLSAWVYLPPGPGPHPTLVGYSGYSPSKPGAPIKVPANLQPIVDSLCATSLPVLCNAPDHPIGIIGGLFGYATVGVNVRGTGCSGGAFDYWETLQVLDGYDVIETIAAQDWVKGGKVGMAGLSYPGISQLFVAQTRPPSLAAIAPLSVIAESTGSTLAPGGIFNDGFAFEWATRVVNNAGPYGQGWEQAQADLEAQSGVTTCADNQKLHGQAVDPIQKALDNPWYDPAVVDPVNPVTFVDEIDVPVFLSGAWQDEQTGAHFATMLDRFVRAPVRRFTVFNGLHPDGFAPQVMAEWKAFLDIYVAERVPGLTSTQALVASFLFEQIFGATLAFPPIPFRNAASWDEAKAAYEAQPPVRAIFENGVGPGLTPARYGAPAGTFELAFDAWPPPQTVAQRLYFHRDGTLRDAPPIEADVAAVFDHDPDAGQRTFGGKQPFYQWAPTAPGSAAVWESLPLDEDLVMLGSASADLFVQSTAHDADLEVMLSEVRPDGQEQYVQAGWLRVSHRKLEDASTELRPIQKHRREDAERLPLSGFALARVEIFPFGHVFREGSRIRISVDTPGDSRERWRFMLQRYESDHVRNFIAHDATRPSSVVLPVIPGVVVPTALPPCPGLRGQPCREHVPYVNALALPPVKSAPPGGWSGIADTPRQLEAVAAEESFAGGGAGAPALDPADPLSAYGEIGFVED